MCCVCKTDIRNAVANLVVILVFNELCCGVLCIQHGYLSLMMPCARIWWVFVQHSDILSSFLVIVIFYCANETALHMPDRKFSKGFVRLNWVAKWVAAWKRLKTIVLAKQPGTLRHCQSERNKHNVLTNAWMNANRQLSSYYDGVSFSATTKASLSK